MAEYQLEYVSGVMILTGSSAAFINEFHFLFANRGGTAEVARGILFRTSQMVLDTGDLNIDPGDIGGWGFGDEAGEFAPLYWARIYTSSANVVPSVQVIAGSTTGPESDHLPWLTYIAPNDFAVFQLPHFPSLPQGPGGPLPTRGRRTGPIKSGKISR